MLAGVIVSRPVVASKLAENPADDNVCEAAVLRKSLSPVIKPVKIWTSILTKELLSESVTMPCGDSSAVPTKPEYTVSATASAALLLDKLTTGRSLTDSTVNS